MHTKTISNRAWIIVASVPWLVIIACAIINTTHIRVRIHIAGRISNINNCGGIIVNINIFYVINRAFGWDVLNFIGYIHTYLPGSVWATGLKPGGIVAAIIFVID